jgi:predicted nucleic acid-binding protein
MTRLIDLVKRLSAAVADRRGTHEQAQLARLDETLQVLQLDYSNIEQASSDQLDVLDETLDQLGDVFGLDELDRALLLIAAAADLDANVALAYGLLRGGGVPGRPSIGLALELVGVSSLSADASARLGSGSHLRSVALVEASAAGPWLSRELWCPDRVVAHLRGLDLPDPDLAAAVLDPVPLPLAGRELLAAALDSGVGLIWLHAPHGTAGLTMAAGSLAEMDVRTLTLIVPMEFAENQAAEFARSAVREAALLGRCLLLDGAQRLFTGDGSAVAAVLAGPVVPLIAVAEVPWDPGWAPSLGPLQLDAPRLTPDDSERLWAAAAGAPMPPGALDGLRLSPQALTRAARYAQLIAGSTDVPLTAALVRQAARSVSGATAPTPAHDVGFADLVLPDLISASIRRLVGWARHRERLVAGGLIVESGGSGGGITALFSGSPGTGKTLAAHVVATELGMDIIRVDLSAIVDKYIGETQKNLERVFRQAESLNVVLFFDEADALFGRRSDVKDAHDRYANQEVAYLLQRMEQFDGITILATNLRGNLDPAFSRRLSFILHFPDPDIPTRKRLWEAHAARLGDQDPADPIDAAHLAAAVELTGGDIRNIVVAAGYDAAIEGVLPGMRHVVAAAVGEYTKLGRRIPAGAFSYERPHRPT